MRLRPEGDGRHHCWIKQSRMMESILGEEDVGVGRGLLSGE
ncbi:MAG: hypothetical protein N2V76_05440 [Methanophagales archaeon]|nr:hypothetical protein [Methanophagales archaeon]